MAARSNSGLLSTATERQTKRTEIFNFMFSTSISKFTLEVILRGVIVKTEIKMVHLMGNAFVKKQ